MTANSKPYEEMSHSELVKLCKAYEWLQRRALDKSGELMMAWKDIPEDDRFVEVRRAFSPLLIDPRPLSDDALAALRKLVGLS